MRAYRLFLLSFLSLSACGEPTSNHQGGDDTLMGDCRQEGQRCVDGFSCEQDATGVYACVEVPEGGTPALAAGQEVAGTESPAGVEVPAGVEAPAGVEVPAGMEAPAGVEVPAGVEAPEGGATPQGGEPVGGEVPAGVEAPMGGEPRTGGSDPMITEAPCASAPTGCPDLGWVQIEGGEFTMGSELGQLDERPLRSVEVPTFHMMRSEVTVSMYRACYDAGACSALSTFSSACTWSDVPDSKEEYPASCMTWFQLRDFAEWVGARLPTEAEWEFAARGRGRDVVYPWGTDIPTCERATYFGCSDGMTVVCSLPDGNTPEGLCDMAGNVWEWVQDEYHSDYQGAPTDGSAWCATDGCEAEPVSAPFRVMRGGYWSGDADVMRASYRGSASPIVEYGFRGGRLAY